jgi:hypothetical protein
MPKVKRTIPIATVSGRDAELSISTDDWKRIESSYGQDVPEIARKEIHGATLGFLLFVAFEPARRPVSESRDRISRLKEVAGAFQKAVFDNPTTRGRSLEPMRIISSVRTLRTPVSGIQTQYALWDW